MHGGYPLQSPVGLEAMTGCNLRSQVRFLQMTDEGGEEVCVACGRVNGETRVALQAA
jgi:hypothetical protein